MPAFVAHLIGLAIGLVVAFVLAPMVPDPGDVILLIVGLIMAIVCGIYAIFDLVGTGPRRPL